jgi:hypothetical protein
MAFRFDSRFLARTSMRSRWAPLVTILAGSVLFAGGCAGNQPDAISAPLSTSCKGSALALAGTWQMDLSPDQDGSYIKDLVIVADVGKNGSTPHAFTGTVYGGSPFDNGQCVSTPSGDVFAFVSDERGELGGPYYWLGQVRHDQKVTGPADSSSSVEVLTGRVRSLSRNLDMPWRATRSSAQR